MANKTLITQSDQMYESQTDTTDYTSLLLDPAAEAMEKNLEEQKKITKELMAGLPEGIDLAMVDEKLHTKITEWTIEQNDKYVKAASVAAKYKDQPGSTKFIEARDKMNQVISAFERLDEEVNGENSIGVKIQNATKNQHNAAGGMAVDKEADMNMFINGTILDKIIEQGISDEGTLSYASSETSEVDNTAEITALETELAALTDDDAIKETKAKITELKNKKGSYKIKKVSKYTGHPEHNAAGVEAINALREKVRKRAEDGKEWDGSDFETDMGVSVDAIIKVLGPDGVKDIMFTYYIDGYIEANTTFKKGSTEFENEKKRLKGEDLTDEFRNHVLGTDTAPGMLENTHTENYTAKTITTPVQYTFDDGNTWRFSHKASTKEERVEEQVVLQALKGDKEIFVEGSGWYDLVDGEYKQRGPFRLIEDSKGRMPEDDDYETTRTAPQKLSPKNFIKQHGGGMQPQIVSGTGFGTASTDEDLEELITQKPPGEMSTEELRMKANNGTASEEEKVEWMKRFGKELEK